MTHKHTPGPWEKVYLAVVFVLTYLLLFLTACNESQPTQPTQPTQPMVPTQSQEDVYLSKIKAAMDYANPVTRDYAVNLASRSPGVFNYGQIFAIFDQLYSNWKYVNDPTGFEYFGKASETIKTNLSGDCDDFAILMAALVTAIGGDTRISLAYSVTTGHAFTEVYIGKVSDGAPTIALKAINEHYSGFFLSLFGLRLVDKVWYRQDSGGGAWLNLDWQSKYPGGQYFDYVRCTIFYPLQNRYTQ
jgi:hypothetical protein